VYSVRAAGEDQDGRVRPRAAEDQRFNNLADCAADRVGGFLGGAGARRQLDHPAWQAEGR
jgi:hypothetical protein